MKIKDIIKDSDVKLVKRGTSLAEVAQLMAERDCGSIPVAENDKLIGMITDRDIVLRCVAKDRDPHDMSADECMSPDILYCYDTDDVEKVIENMGEQAVRRLPVVDKDKKLVGIVSFGDLSAACEDKADSGRAMTKIRKAAA